MMKYIFLGLVVLVVLLGTANAALVTTLESENASCEHDPTKLTAVYVTAYYLDEGDALLKSGASKTITYAINVEGEANPASIYSDSILGNGWGVYFETNNVHQTTIPSYENIDGTPTPNILYASDFTLFSCDPEIGCYPARKATRNGQNDFLVTMENNPNVPLQPGDPVYYSAIVSCFTPQELSSRPVLYPGYPLLTPAELAALSSNYCQTSYHLAYSASNTLYCVADAPVEVPEFGEWIFIMLFAGCVIIAVSRRT